MFWTMKRWMVKDESLGVVDESTNDDDQEFCNLDNISYDC